LDYREASALRERSLLLVEDEGEVAAFLRDLFALDGWVVDVVTDGRQALAALQVRDYRVIVSDIVMPEVDGAGLYREVARWRPELLPRFIFISGFADTDTADFLRQTRAPMISKPFRFDEIRQAVDEVLGTEPPAP
jgi:DNA-binding NtrC family response regulator